MKKGFILALLLMVSITFVYSISVSDLKSFDSVSKQHTFHMKVGWNLIPFVDHFDEVTSTCNSDVLTKNSWIYSPTAKEYWKITDLQSGKKSELFSLDESQGYKYSGINSGAMFVYSDRSCDIVFSAGETSKNKVAKGWNFMSIDKSMIGKKMIDSWYKEGCSFSKLAFWNSVDQKWEFRTFTISELQSEGNVQEEHVGIVYGVKYDQDCTLNSESGSASDNSSPPALTE